MRTAVTRDEVRDLVRAERAHVVDVLPPQEYADEHLVGAINIPLRKLVPETVAVLERGRPVVVYCHDTL